MESSGRAEFATDLARRRAAAGLSLARVAAAAHIHRGYLHRVEAGRQWPTRPVAQLLDDALHARGVLLAAWRDGEAARQLAAEDERRLAASARESRRLVRLLDDAPLGEAVTVAEQATAVLAVDCLHNPPAPTLTAALDARTAIVRALHRAPNAGQRRDLIRAAGYLSGVLVYAALDLDHGRAATDHAATAWCCADATGDRELAAWVRDAQSLIARVERDFPTALALARDGLDHYAGQDTSTIRLLADVAKNAASLGDRAETHRALNAAADAADHAGLDAFPGLFTFSRAGLASMGGFALTWFDEPADARGAVVSASTAIALWQVGDPADRSQPGEALAHVYAAIAGVQLGELDAAAAMLDAVLTLPDERRISFLRRNVARVGDLLAAPRFRGSMTAGDLRVAVAGFS
ncbi:MAG: helix-turn-helix domain-containing protein [Pseudonocardia sp.]